MVRVNTIKLSQKGGRRTNVRKAGQNKAPKLRASIKAGQVVILLQGQFRGKHAIVLKQLEKSGMLLVSGPYGLNGVPLRRVNQRYVIATSQNVNVAGVDVSNVTDEYFKRAAEKKGEFSEKSAKPVVSSARKATQKAVDAALTKAIGGDAIFKKYLRSKFALSNSQNA